MNLNNHNLIIVLRTITPDELKSLKTFLSSLSLFAERLFGVTGGLSLPFPNTLKSLIAKFSDAT